MQLFYTNLHYFLDIINICSLIPLFLLFPLLPLKLDRVNIKTHLLLFKREPLGLQGALPLENNYNIPQLKLFVVVLCHHVM